MLVDKAYKWPHESSPTFALSTSQRILTKPSFLDRVKPLHPCVSRLNWLKYRQHVQVSKIKGKESPPPENRLIRYSISKLGTWILCWKWMWMILNDDLAPTVGCRSIAYMVKLAHPQAWLQASYYFWRSNHIMFFVLSTPGLVSSCPTESEKLVKSGEK